MGWGGGCLIDGKPFSFEEPYDGKAMSKDSEHWYDYVKMAGSYFPPAGEKVQFSRLSYPWTDGEVIGMNSRGECVIEYEDGWIAIHYEDNIRPMDWDKNSNTLSIDDLAQRIVLSLKTVMNFNMDINTAKNIAGKILAAGYRKCDKGE